MQITAQQIFEDRTPKDELAQLLGNKAAIIENIAAFESGKSGDLVFAPNQSAVTTALKNKVALIVLPKKLAQFIPPNTSKTAFILSNNIGVSHARLKQKYADHDYTKSGWETIHPSAIIHESVTIPKGTNIGPNVVIEKGVTLGKDCRIMANVVLEHGAKIGNNVTIHPGTIIGWDCEIGDNCLFLSNSVIGGEGFGYAQDQYFNHHRIPQTGKVIIGNKVTIGALNTIDRGTYGPTIIGNGCIFDNMCHVAHNVKLGENCIILSGFLCAGSSILGNRVVASGGTMIKDHVEICDNTYLVHRAGVIKNITKPGVYAGSPVLPMQEYVKSNAIYRELGELRKMVLELTEKLAKK
ncbi:MAG: UDP-3-O-(3-hydroxymyristoyl)glucosamine N-acyltransferase [Saprospiraceae bacterium]